MFAENLKIVNREIKKLAKSNVPSIAIYMIEEEKKKAIFLRDRSKGLDGPHKKQCYERSMEHINNCTQMISSIYRFEMNKQGETKCQQ